MKSLGAHLLAAVLIGSATLHGCQATKPAPQRTASAPIDLQPARIDYVDSDAFDVLFETTLLNGPPVIAVQTEFDKPEWGPRLNAWIAAWNMGGRKARGQIPTLPKIVVDGDSIREFRLLVDDLMTRVEDSARAGTQWWAEKRMREQRVALLKPYNLRFHMDARDKIQLIFFHGDYAAQHSGFVRTLGNADEESAEWTRTYCCSRCKEKSIPATTVVPTSGGPVNR